ncbi:hypothetical protein COT60_02535 [Candidatus Pacearchaeota archaeon CG09_land_8_20_14_0_10_30_9]|nr:hypothetical protein [Candidatus Pacearchaeota archaeon]OIO40165.1 MAG: hypothetical protein AUJ61_02385 [Candidatus Pacearchaeota archaeon CG1_02_30_18]PIN71407.1 MAG: hypothetical protein COV77_02110 [Candidatus Pacearchaeota archaeon CG11_big_fil_rev_8_21_14_0_20_30_13]PIO01041.1 MAG: hypothetical protein COT60_02535 [Candidatus Pacearchaeota archaeon CG09_land_8_20_14_0_10_30_9]PIZ82278.1 MAG: hypothetical protein COX98_00335 [Candidatus Pacearchaeota archaeon CG_4_10_14_0_2_um_filter_30
MENKKDFYSNLNHNRRKNVQEEGIFSNCIGTALYLVGEKEKDEYLWKERQKILRKLTPANSPELGYLVSWERKGKTFHLGVVVNKTPLKIAERDGCEGPFNPSKLSTEIDERYFLGEKGDEVKYYIPSKLQKILEKEGELK